jgi:hypothetical protein
MSPSRVGQRPAPKPPPPPKPKEEKEVKPAPKNVARPPAAATKPQARAEDSFTGQARPAASAPVVLRPPEPPPTPKPPSEQSIPERVGNFFKGFGLEAVDTVKGMAQMAKLAHDINPILQVNETLGELIFSPISGKSPGQIVQERTERFMQAGNVLVQQGTGLLKLASDLSTPAMMTNAVKMTDAMVRDVMALNAQGKLTPGAIAGVISERTAQNPSIQAASTVLDSVTNYKAIIESGGDPEQIGRGAFRIFETLIDFAKPAAKGLKATVPEQALRQLPLGSAERSMLDALSTPGSRIEVPRADIPLEGLARLTKESGREFAVLTRGDRRLIIAGDATSVPLTPAEMKKLSDEGWKLTAHSHVEGLTPSVGDGRVVSAGGQKRSIIVDSENGRISFKPEEGTGGATDNLSAGRKSKAQEPEPARPVTPAVVRLDDVRSTNLGEKLDEFVQKMKQARTDGIPPGGSLKLTAPEVQGKNNLLPPQSVEFTFSPENLYVHEMKVGDVKVTFPEGAERYPGDTPRVVLQDHEIDSLIRNFNDYVKKNAQGDSLQISLTNPPKELSKLPDLIAMMAEGSRFPDIRNHIKSLQNGGTGVEAVWTKGLEEWEAHGTSYQNFDPERILPSHYLHGWEKRYTEGAADFRLPQWTQRPTP